MRPLSFLLFLCFCVSVQAADITIYRYFYDNNHDGIWNSGDTYPPGNVPNLSSGNSDDFVRFKFVPVFVGETSKIPPSGNFQLKIRPNGVTSENTIINRGFSGATTDRTPATWVFTTQDGYGGPGQVAEGVWREIRGFATTSSIPSPYVASGFATTSAPRVWHRVKWEHKPLTPGAVAPYKNLEYICEVPFDLGLLRSQYTVEIYSSQRVDAAVEYWIKPEGLETSYRVNPAGNPPSLTWLSAMWYADSPDASPVNVWVYKRVQGVTGTVEWYRGTIYPWTPLVLRDSNGGSTITSTGAPSTVTGDGDSTTPPGAPPSAPPPASGVGAGGVVVSTSGNGTTTSGGGGGPVNITADTVNVDLDAGSAAGQPTMPDIGAPSASDKAKMQAINDFADTVGGTLTSAKNGMNTLNSSTAEKVTHMDAMKTQLESVKAFVPHSGAWDWKVPLTVAGTNVLCDLGPYKVAFMWLRSVLVIIILIAFWKASGRLLRRIFEKAA